MKKLLLPALALLLVPPLSAAPGDLDQAFLNNLGAGITGENYPTHEPPGAQNAVALQPDGKILVGGSRSRFNNTGELTALKRLNPDGTLDATFGPGVTYLAGPHDVNPEYSSEINAILVNPDGSFYIGGVFNRYGNPAEVRSCVAKIHADGTLDTSFTPPPLSGGALYVQTLALDGKGGLFVGGTFFTGGKSNLVRLDAATGALDTTFTADGIGTQFTVVDSVSMAADGRILISGTLNTNRPHAYRLFSDGTRDLSFQVPFANSAGRVNKVLALPDGRVVIGGTYDMPGQSGTATFLTGLTRNGTPDPAFQANLGTGSTGWMGGVLQLMPDGRILTGGIFSSFDGTSVASLVILGQDGTRDVSFTPPAYVMDTSYITHVYGAAVQPDGKILACGWFDRISDPDLELRNLVRFEGDSATPGAGTLAFSATTVTAAENAGSVTLQVARLPGITGAVSVNYATGGGTAVAGTHYTDTSGTLNWADGEGGVKTIQVPLLDNDTAAADKTFLVTLSAATGGAVLGANPATVTILDDEALPEVITPPADVTLNQGANLNLSVTVSSLLPVSFQWQYDGGGGFQNLIGQTGRTLLITQVTPEENAGLYRVLVSNINGEFASEAATVVVNVPAGSVIPAFSVSLPNPVTRGVLDAEGRFLLATSGTLTVVRRNADGSVDNSFTSPVFDNGITSLLPLPDGKLLVSGYFSNVGGVPRRGVARLNANGTLDESFNLGLTLSVQSLSAGAGGKIYVGPASGSGNGLRRYKGDGTLDAGFTPANIGTGVSNGFVWAVRENGDGTLLVSHQTSSGFSTAYSFTKLNVADGTVVPGFNVGDMNWNIYDWDFLPDGRIVIGGRFSTVEGLTRNRIAILNADGSLSDQFDAGVGPNGPVLGVKYHQGRILVWGSFTQVNDAPQGGIARFNLDGSNDPTFVVGTGASSAVNALFLPPGGPIQIFGQFTSFNGVAKNHAAALVLGPGSVGFDPARVTVIEGGVTIPLTLRRYGSTDEAASISYETVDGTAEADTDYAAASGTVTWAAGDAEDKTVNITLVDNDLIQSTRSLTVQLSDPVGDIMPAANATIHILDNDTPVTFTEQPVGASIFAGGSFTLTAATTSPTPTTYQWFLNGSPVTVANAASYSRTGAAQTEGGVYSLVATNAAGSFVSEPALVVIAPTPGSVSASLAAEGVRLSISDVRAIAPTADGGTWLGGQFSFTENSVTYTNLVRVHADGTLNTAFNPAPNNSVECLLLVEDERLLVGGSFTTLGGQTARRFARLNADGTLDTAFTTNLDVGGAFLNNTSLPASNTITRIARLSDGRIVITGGSNGSFGQFHLIAADGLRDLTFQGINKANNNITSLAIQPDDMILIGGVFTQYNNVNVNKPVRVNPDGTRDTTFLPSGATGGTLADILVDRLGRIFLAGNNLSSSVGFAGLSSTGTYTTNMGNNNTLRLLEEASHKVLVLKAGTLTRFKGSDPLPTPGSNDFDSTFPAFLPGGNMKAIATGADRAIWVGGLFPGGFTKLNSDPADPSIVNPPASQAVNPGATAFFSVGAVGTELEYQWFKDGVELTDGGDISGATGPILSIANIEPADDDVYHVEVTGGDPEDTVASAPVRLRVLGAPEAGVPLPEQTPARGSTLTLAPEVYAAQPATYVWTRDGVPIINGGRYSGAGTATLVIEGVNAGDNGVYLLTITNGLGSANTSVTVAVNQPAHERDPLYSAAPTPALAVSSGSSNVVRAFAPLADGRMLVAVRGSLSGTGGTSVGGNLVVVGTDGAVTSLPGGGTNSTGYVYALHRQADGKILVAGDFNTVAGGFRSRLARLNADLTLDTGFNPNPSPPSLASQPVRIVADHDGRVYIGGNFTNYGGVNGANHLVRLLPDGTQDTTFNLHPNGAVQALAIQADGAILVGGLFTQAGATETGGLFRLTPAGALDGGFNHPIPTAVPVTALALDPSGRIYAATGGAEITVRRLLATGAADGSFSQVGGLNAAPAQLLVLSDGRVIAAGNFTSPATRILGLTPTGTVDATFLTGTGFNNEVTTLGTDYQGRIWAGGLFTQFNSATANRILVMQGAGGEPLYFLTEPASQIADVGAASVQFSATAAGTNGFTFQWRKNGAPLSNGGRISGADTGTLTIADLNASDAADYSVTLSSPGQTSLESRDASLTLLAAPVLLSEPQDLTVDLGGTAVLSGSAEGASPLNHQWFHFDTPLTDGPGVSGATTNTLTLTGVTFARAGDYKLRVSNFLDIEETRTAVLTVQRRPGAPAGIPQPTFNNTVRAILLLPDGSYIVGGSFGTVTVNGVTTNRGRIARFLADGTLDPNFAPSFNNDIHAIARDSSGRIFVGGRFTSVVNNSVTTTVTRVARFTPELALDTTFNTMTGPNDIVHALAPVGDGSVYIGGEFDAVGGVSGADVVAVARLKNDGSLDTAFKSRASSNSEIYTMLRRPNGQLYIGGLMTSYDGSYGQGAGLCLVNASGARVTGFVSPGVTVNARSIFELNDGTLLVGQTAAGQYAQRYHPDTGAQLGFTPDPKQNVLAIAQQANGKVLLGGMFNLSFGDFLGFANHLYRAAPEGAVDTGFDLGTGFNTNGHVYALAVDGAGRIYVGGAFISLNGVSQNRFVILNGGEFESRNGAMASQTITFAAIADRVFNPAANSVPISPTSSSGLPVSVAVTSGPATISGGTVTITGAGEVTLTATQAGDDTYGAAVPVVRSFTVAKADQTIGFSAPADRSSASAPFNLSASATSGLPVTFSLISGPASILGGTVTLTGEPGTVVIQASQAGDANWNAAAPVQQSFEATDTPPVTVAQVITFPKPPAKRFLSESPVTLFASASSGLDVVFEVVAGPATVNGSQFTFTGTGKVTVRATQPGGPGFHPAPPVTQSFTVAPDPAKLTLTDLVQVYDGTPRAVNVIGNTEAPDITYIINKAESDTPPVSAGSYAVAATADGKTVKGKLVVLKAPLTATPDSHRRFIGQNNPPLTLAYSGFLAGDDESVFDAPGARRPVVSTTAKSNSPGGVYPIKAAGGVLANYALVYVSGSMTVESFAGRYEALLVDGTDQPAAKVELTVAASSTALSGKLTVPGETAALSFKGTLSVDADTETATGATAEFKKGANTYLIEFTLPLGGDFTADLSLNGAPLAATDEGKKIYLPVKGDAIPAGTHTLSLAPAQPAGADTPSGSGYALATLDGKGVLKLAGRLADGTALTGALMPDAAYGYRLLALPYKRLDSHLTGWLDLEDHDTLANRKWIPFTSSVDLLWEKAEGTKDKSYRAGIGPVTTRVTLDPWLKPDKNNSLAALLELPPGEEFFAEYDGFTSDAEGNLPTDLQLDAKNKILILGPATTPANATKWTAKFNTANGLITGSLTLSDTLPGATRPTARKVPFTGVLRQPHGTGAGGPIGAGYLLVPALPGAPTNEITSGSILFEP